MSKPNGQELGRELFFFGVFGVTTTVLNYGAFYLLYRLLSVPYLVASAVGFVLGVVVGFPLNSRWTFRKPGSAHFIPYALVYLCSLTSGLGLLWGLTSLLGLDPRLGNLVTLLYTISFNFLVLRFTLFYPRKGS